MAITQTFYVDPAVADGGDGSFATPYNRLDLAVTAATAAEARIRVRRGRVYTPYGTKLAVLDLANKRPTGLLIVDDYGDEEGPPVLFGGTYMAPASGGWEYRGGGVWRKPLAANAGGADPDGFRLYLGSAITGAAVNQSAGTGYTFGLAAARCNVAKTADEATILASLNSIARPDTLNRRLWMYTQKSDGVTFDGFLYVYTGSDTLDPPAYYGGLTLVGRNGLTDASGFGRSFGVWLYNAQRVTVRGMRVACAPSSMRVSAAAYPTTDCALERCESMAYGTDGIIFDGTVTNAASRNVARDCTVDAVATLNEDWNWRDKGGVAWLPASQNGAVIERYTDACAFERVTCIDGNHENFYIGGLSSSAGMFTSNARLTDCVARSPGRDYGPCISSGGMGAGNVAYIDRFNGSDCIGWIHKTGAGRLLISDSYFGECKRPYPAYDQTTGGGGQDGLGVNLAPGMDIFANASHGTVEVGAITATRCAFINPYGWMIQIFGHEVTDGNVQAGALQATDCLFVDRKNINNAAARTFNPGVMDRVGCSIETRDAYPVTGVVVFNNVTYWTGTVGGAVCSVPNPPGQPITVTLAAYGLTTVSEADPVVDATGRPLEGSPLLGLAPTNGLTRDASGRYRETASARGAYEYVRPRPSRTLP